MLLLKVSDVRIINTSRDGGDSVTGESVSDRVVFARNMLECAVELGYGRKVSLLSG